MIISVLTDLHFGNRNDHSIHASHLKKALTKFVKYIDDEKITDVIINGDVFDNRKGPSTIAIKAAIDFFAQLTHCKIIINIGNHDIVYRNTLSFNSLDILSSVFDNITIIDKPTVVYDTILVVPWICDENRQECLNAIKNTSAKICFTHADIQGTTLAGGYVADFGFEPSIFSKFYKVYNGHIHIRGSHANVITLGTIIEHDWGDYSTSKGFYTFDTKDLQHTYIRNKDHIHAKYLYNDDKIAGMPIPEFMSKYDLSDKIVKILVDKVIDSSTYIEFCDTIHTNSYSASVIEESLINDVSSVELDLHGKDTITLIREFISEDENLGDLKESNLIRLVNVVYKQAAAIN